MKRLVWITALAAAHLMAQQNALLNTRQAVPVMTRAVQLMESTSLVVPNLARAAAPVLENARQALANLQAAPGQNSGLTYTFLTEVRAYLALADTLPKPFPFPEEARRQFAELRDTSDRIESHFQALLDLKERQVRSPDRDNLRRYAESNARLSPPSPDVPRVVFLGDSITDGWRLNEYFSGRDFVNRGISGQITGEMLGRMKADVIDLKPKAMIVLAGTNDLARGVPAGAIENNLTMIADLAEFHEIKPIFASILPVSGPEVKRRPPDQIREINQWLRAFCEQRKFQYVDYYSALVDSQGFLQADVADDGLHPNAKGYRIIAPIALEAIDRALKPAAPVIQQKKRRFKLM